MKINKNQSVDSPPADKKAKKLQPISNKLLAAGVIGVLVAANLPFLSEPVRSVIHWASISLVVISMIILFILVFDEMKRMRGSDGTFRTRPNRYSKRTSKKEFPAVLYIVSISVVALGLSLIFLFPHGYQGYRIQSQASSWPHTIGEVISAEVIVDEGDFAADDDMVQPKIVTQYTVNGRTYLIREISFNQSLSWSTSYRYANAMTSKYSPGTPVPVYYNPKQPSQAVLDTSVDWFTYFIIGLGAVLVVFGVYWFWLCLRDTWLFFASLLRK